MSDLSIRSFSGANPVSVPRPAPPDPPTAQHAVAQPLTNSQSAVTQSPNTGTGQWRNQRGSHADIQQQQGSTAQPQQSATAQTPEQLADNVAYLNQFLQRFDTALQFEMDDQYSEMVVRIVDRETKEVIRQIPSEETLAFAKFFKELEKRSQNLPESPQGSPLPDSQRLKVEGLLLDTKV